MQFILLFEVLNYFILSCYQRQFGGKNLTAPKESNATKKRQLGNSLCDVTVPTKSGGGGRGAMPPQF